MEAALHQISLLRPVISEFEDPGDFVRAMIEFLKKTEKNFSVYTETKFLRKISPTLISLILSKKRRLTLDRVDELAKLLRLNAQEKIYFKNWLSRREVGLEQRDQAAVVDHQPRRSRKDVTTHILNDWINVYVKDCFQLSKVQKNPDLVYRYLSSYAHPRRIEKAINFLLKEGHLRRTLDGSIVVEANLVVADPQLPSKKIRQFHRGALGVAKAALELFPATERFANTLIIPLNEKSYAELLEIINEFSERLKNFAEHNQEEGDRLYQLVLNLCPTGGKVE